ncbi:MAG: hypothetical protein IT190_08470 [Microbacteriaceae bacterium]|nr:hypothetical protein [Microbacteriaceae bacterium]
MIIFLREMMERTMATVQTLTRRFERVFEPEQAVVLAETITEAYNDLIKTNDFNDLKAIVKDLAIAQRETKAELQQLAQAQRETEAQMKELARVVTNMGQELGGLSRSMSYSLENEAYRTLPAYLREHHGITVTDRIVRTDIGGEEINFFALGERNGVAICLVGESKLQLDERRNSRREAERLIAQIESKVDAVRQLYPEREMVRLLVTHYARPAIRQFLQEHNIIVVQTFEW